MKREALVMGGSLLFAGGCVLSSVGSSSQIADAVMPAYLYSNILAVILGASVLVRAVILARVQKNTESPAVRREAWNKTTAAVMACSIGYVLGVAYIGFYITSFAVITILYLSFEGWDKGKLRNGILFALGVDLLLMLMFRALSLYIPEALLF